MKNTKLVECSSVPVRVSEATARHLDELCKTLPTGCEYKRKAYDASILFEPNERAEVSVITSSTVDKTNEVVIAAGVNKDSYNGVVLWNHDQDRPIADCQWIKYHKADQSLRAKTVYPEKPGDFSGSWFTDEVWACCKSGILKAKSIGFKPLVPLREPTAEELAENPTWANAGIYESVLLLEYSCCAIGICNDAIVEAINKSLVSADQIKDLGIDWQQPTAPVQGISLQQAIAIASKTKAFKAKKKAKKSVDIEALINKAAKDMAISSDRILELAEQLYKKRGRV